MNIINSNQSDKKICNMVSYLWILKSVCYFLADRAKQIKTKAIVNEDPTEKLIHSLQEVNVSL